MLKNKTKQKKTAMSHRPNFKTEMCLYNNNNKFSLTDLLCHFSGTYPNLW